MNYIWQKFKLHLNEFLTEWLHKNRFVFDRVIPPLPHSTKDSMSNTNLETLIAILSLSQVEVSDCEWLWFRDNSCLSRRILHKGQYVIFSECSKTISRNYIAGSYGLYQNTYKQRTNKHVIYLIFWHSGRVYSSLL